VRLTNIPIGKNGGKEINRMDRIDRIKEEMMKQE
jgi:hypothetical protein